PLISKHLQRSGKNSSPQTDSVSWPDNVNYLRNKLRLSHLPPTLFSLEPSPLYGGLCWLSAWRARAAPADITAAKPNEPRNWKVFGPWILGSFTCLSLAAGETATDSQIKENQG